MKLTQEQIEFLNGVCYGKILGQKWTLNSDGEVDVDGTVDMTNMHLTEIPVKFGSVGEGFICSFNNLTSLNGYPTKINGKFGFEENNLTNYFKSIKEEDFPHWDKLYWGDVLREYPFLINTIHKYSTNGDLELYLSLYPLTKLYYKD
jgi:hypothetical protein